LHFLLALSPKRSSLATIYLVLKPNPTASRSPALPHPPSLNPTDPCSTVHVFHHFPPLPLPLPHLLLLFPITPSSHSFHIHHPPSHSFLSLLPTHRTRRPIHSLYPFFANPVFPRGPTPYPILEIPFAQENSSSPSLSVC
jgi:hypothetical protein